jgi:hypothetical protein
MGEAEARRVIGLLWLEQSQRVFAARPELPGVVAVRSDLGVLFDRCRAVRGRSGVLRIDFEVGSWPCRLRRYHLTERDSKK